MNVRSPRMVSLDYVLDEQLLGQVRHLSSCSDKLKVKFWSSCCEIDSMFAKICQEGCQRGVMSVRNHWRVSHD
jgi:hypothetical protein